MQTLVQVEEEARGCTRCALSRSRTNVVFGVGDPHADLMFVGEGPGEREDLQGEPFVGKSGRLLDQLMWEELGMGRDRCYIANVVLCRPPGNRDPRPEEIAACNPFLEAKLDLIGPKVVVTLGNFATRLLLGTTDGINRVRGRAYPFRGGVLVPTFHPAAVLRGGGDSKAKMRADLVRAKQYLRGPVPRMITALTKSADDTRALAAELAPFAVPGDLIVLAGQLGAGKTAFAQGFARGLGVTEPITSPAFVLVRTYDGRIPLAHVDVYRLDLMQELLDLGIAELLDEGGVSLVEWGDAVGPGLPAEFLEVRLMDAEADDERLVRVTPVGAAWAPRWAAVSRALERWQVEGTKSSPTQPGDR